MVRVVRVARFLDPKARGSIDMQATSLIGMLKEQGLTLAVVGDKVRVWPGSRIPSNVDALIRSSKPALLDGAEVLRRLEMWAECEPGRWKAIHHRL